METMEEFHIFEIKNAISLIHPLHICIVMYSILKILQYVYNLNTVKFTYLQILCFKLNMNLKKYTGCF